MHGNRWQFKKNAWQFKKRRTLPTPIPSDPNDVTIDRSAHRSDFPVRTVYTICTLGSHVHPSAESEVAYRQDA